jgi:LPS O-antigen subunit length determinant protein (WzzB/FepE family)
MIINNKQDENGTAESEIDLLALAALLWEYRLIIIIATLLLAV